MARKRKVTIPKLKSVRVSSPKYRGSKSPKVKTTKIKLKKYKFSGRFTSRGLR